jgi:hypothetical protein
MALFLTIWVECCCDVILRGDAPFERVAAVSAISTR